MSFAKRLEHFGQQIALISEEGEKISYIDLARTADAIFSGRKAPNAARTLIAVECENRLPSVAGYLGALRNNFPVLLSDARQAPELKNRVYAHYRVPFVLNVAGNWEITGHSGPEVHPDVAVLLSTSGTTGSSKLVRLSYGAIESNANSILGYLGLQATDRPVTTLPIHYSYGLSVLNSHFSVGARLLLTTQPITARKFWDFFRSNEATGFSGVPTTYRMLKQFRFERMNLPSLRTMTQAGGRLDPESVRWFAELAQGRDQRFFVMYGQTEATARIAYIPPDRLLEKCGSIGIPIPGGFLDLVGPDGSLVTKPDTTGELRYHGPNVMMGYAFDTSHLAAPDLQNSILLTGDLAWFDNDGFFYLAGRLKRFLKVFGNRISLDEVEAQLREDGFDGAVSGRDDLILIAVKNLRADIEHLAAHVSARYRLHRSAIRVVAVELPTLFSR